MRLLRVLLGGFAGLVLLVSVLLSVLRNVDTGVRPLAMATTFASYALVGYVLALVLLLLLVRRAGRARPPVLAGAVLAVAGVLVQGWWTAPLFVGNGGGTRVDLTVMTANLQFGEGDANTIVRTAVDQKVDVLVLEEVTFPEYAGLQRAGLTELLPNRVGEPEKSAAGTMVFSRYRLTDAGQVAVSNGGTAVTVGAPKPFRIIAVHPSQPVKAPGTWRSDLGEVRRAAAESVQAGPTLVAGDFNATRDHVRFRDILAVGLSDADAEANSGWQPTWPESLPRSPNATGRPRDLGGLLRPLIAIDHVLSSHQFSAVRTSTVPISGSDHRALVVQLERF
ncbi:MAG: endonuclease/exonuclease/phosphatase family protein [Marmoricola sp.]